MTKTPIELQDLRRRMYLEAKADKAWRFWGLYVHVCKQETLRTAYAMAKENGGASGCDGVTFEAIEQAGVEAFLDGIRDELVSQTYWPTRNRRVEIPKGDGRVRVLGIPTIRDRVVQGALKLIVEPIFEADFQEGSYGYCPRRSAHQAVQRVAEAVVQNKTTVIDVDVASYCDTVRHDILLRKVAERVKDATPQAVQDCHALLLWLIPQLDKFPRARRFTLGERLETGLLAVLEHLVEAAYSRDKVQGLKGANRRLQSVRHLWRLAYELGVIPLRRYSHGSGLLESLGRQVGGWLKAREVSA